MSAPSLDSVKSDFEQDQEKIDQLVELFQKTSKIAYVGRYLFDSVIGRGGSVSISYFESDIEKNKELPFGRREYRPGGEELQRALDLVTMPGDKFDGILAAMRKADVRIIRFNDGKERRFVEVAYPDTRVGFGLGCSWRFVTPLRPYTVQEILEKESLVTDAMEGEKGPYIINDQWLVYMGCKS